MSEPKSNRKKQGRRKKSESLKQALQPRRNSGQKHRLGLTRQTENVLNPISKHKLVRHNSQTMNAKEVVRGTRTIWQRQKETGRV